MEPIFLLLIYFLPAIIALERKTEKAGLILLLNVVAGWTGIAWIACFIWAAIDKPRIRNEERVITKI